jgi:hypothetical protein
MRNPETVIHIIEFGELFCGQLVVCQPIALVSNAVVEVTVVLNLELRTFWVAEDAVGIGFVHKGAVPNFAHVEVGKKQHKEETREQKGNNS